VRMTPILVAVKVKAPTCVAVLLEFGADIKMKLLTLENKPLSIAALELAEGERAVAMKNDREADIAIYDQIVQLIKEHAKKKKKRKPKKADEPKDEEPVEPAAGKPAKDGIGQLPSSISLNNIEKPPLNSSAGAGGDLVTSASIGSLSVSMPNIVPPSPSSVVDMHKLTLRTTQSQLAIKRLEEKNEQLQKEIEALRSDIELIKKFVVSLDITAAEKLQLEGTNRRKTLGPTKISSEKSIPKQKPPAAATDPVPPKKSKAPAKKPVEPEPVNGESDDSEGSAEPEKVQKKKSANPPKEKKEKPKQAAADDEKIPKKSSQEEKPVKKKTKQAKS